ncbi:hypothetical protein PCANC_13589 [Puccinia coronata f. sp. avenae]|uniref:Secreted protein n=1 Tax=Puccinia coronata f. sp. avenae TaxID=200324 RepID=A0A2N5T4Z9_9BASI|nr:hypothetical protein PCANC_13589 [Puccinia coronata f. sp. avenae]
MCHSTGSNGLAGPACLLLLLVDRACSLAPSTTKPLRPSKLCQRNSDPSATPPVCRTTAGTFTSISLAVSVDTLHPYEY